MVQLDLRHIINSEILIYPGYVPQPGVKYRVFHYGLEFRVGNWSFDKANWRTVDVVNKCWSKFPDPPNPSTLDRTDENKLQRDLLSIECADTLNKALLLHHEKRKCSDPTSLSTSNQETSGEVRSSRKFGTMDTVRVIRSDTVLKNDSIESSKDSKESTDDSKESLKDSKESSEDSKESSEDSKKPSKDSKESYQTFSSFRFWIVYLWIFGILGFLAVMYTMLSGRRGHRKRGKNYKHNRRLSYSGYVDTSGHDRHLRNAESS